VSCYVSSPVCAGLFAFKAKSIKLYLSLAVLYPTAVDDVAECRLSRPHSLKSVSIEPNLITKRKHSIMSMAISSNTPSMAPVAQAAPRPVAAPKVNDGDSDDGGAKPAAGGNVQSLPLATSGTSGTVVNIAVK
jgi:hypothetical protein